MTALDTFGTLKTKILHTKVLKIEAESGLTVNTNTVSLRASNNIVSYKLKLPSALPTHKSALQVTTPAVFPASNELSWNTTVDFTTGILGPESVKNDNTMHSQTLTGNIFFGINGIWKRINNWFTQAGLPTYGIIHDESITHDSDTDKYYIASGEIGGFYQIHSEKLDHTTEVVDVNGNEATVVPTVTFNNKNADTPLHDAWYCGSNAYNNGTIVQKILNNKASVFTSYVEWEFVGPGTFVEGSQSQPAPITNAQFEKIGFGFIDKDVFNDNPGVFSAASTDWGFNVSGNADVTRSNGVLAFPDGNYYFNNGTVQSAAVQTILGASFNVKYGDKVQVGTDGDTTLEVILIQNNNISHRLTVTETFVDMASKRFYITMGDSSLAWRVSKKPLPYQGNLPNLFAGHPNTYVLNLVPG